jgi:hypothetical protein
LDSGSDALKNGSESRASTLQKPKGFEMVVAIKTYSDMTSQPLVGSELIKRLASAENMNFNHLEEARTEPKLDAWLKTNKNLVNKLFKDNNIRDSSDKRMIEQLMFLSETKDLGAQAKVVLNNFLDQQRKYHVKGPIGLATETHPLSIARIAGNKFTDESILPGPGRAFSTPRLFNQWLASPGAKKNLESLYQNLKMTSSEDSKDSKDSKDSIGYYAFSNKNIVAKLSFLSSTPKIEPSVSKKAKILLKDFATLYKAFQSAILSSGIDALEAKETAGKALFNKKVEITFFLKNEIYENNSF